MKFFVVAAGIACVSWVGGIVHAVHVEQAGSSTWSGVYTEAQAKQGQAAYAKHCAECHGEDLAGDGFAPGLKGPDFMTNWNGLTLGELYDRIRISMPPNNPNQATAKEKIDIISFILKEDGFPAGQAELPTAADQLKTIKFEATKPGM